MVERLRPVQLKFFVTKEEKDFIYKKMSLMNVKNMSAYLRKMAIDGYLLNVDYSNFNDISKSIDSISRNINQIAKRVNTTDNLYADDVRQLKKNQEEIWQLLKSILSELP